MKLSKKRAKELSIKKWEYIVSNKGSSGNIIEKVPELKNLSSNCGYCEKYYNRKDLKSIQICGKCPLVLDQAYDTGHACLYEDHPFRIWMDNKTTENAQIVLDLIRKT